MPTFRQSEALREVELNEEARERQLFYEHEQQKLDHQLKRDQIKADAAVRIANSKAMAQMEVAKYETRNRTWLLLCQGPAKLAVVLAMALLQLLRRDIPQSFNDFLLG